jgi:hypothetical protein
MAKVVLTALCARRPKARYQVGYMAGVAALAEYLPQPPLDFVLNKRA